MNERVEDILDYYLGLCVCVCDSTLPIGSCRHCDLMTLKAAFQEMDQRLTDQIEDKNLAMEFGEYLLTATRRDRDDWRKAYLNIKSELADKAAEAKALQKKLNDARADPPCPPGNAAFSELQGRLTAKTAEAKALRGMLSEVMQDHRPPWAASEIFDRLVYVTAAKELAVSVLKELCDWCPGTSKEPMWQRARACLATLEKE